MYLILHEICMQKIKGGGADQILKWNGSQTIGNGTLKPEGINNDKVRTGF